MSRLRLIACIALLPLLAGCTNVFLQPSRQLLVNPALIKVTPQPVAFQSRDGTLLSGWLFHASPGGGRPLVVQFHGNGENMTSHYGNLYWLVEQGFDLLTFDYRGYGASHGEAEMAGAVADGVAALTEAAELTHHRPGSVIVYGQSLGANLVLNALTRFQEPAVLRAVVLESTFWSHPEIATEKLGDIWLTWPFQWLGCLLVSHEFEPNAKQLAKLAPLPFLSIHGDADWLVPMHHGREVYQHLPAPKCFWEVRGGQHINAMHVQKGRWRPLLKEYLLSGKCEDRVLDN